jgi:5'-nucleotidase
MEATLGEVVASFTEPLVADGARSGASALGSLVANAWREACASEIAVVNSGSLRGDLPAGPVRMRDVVSVLPFGNQLVVRRVSGADLVASLEHGARGIATRRGTLLHTAGLDYQVVLDAGAQEPRLLDITVGGKPIEPERVYRVAMSNYLARGGDGFERLAASAAPEPGCATGGDAAALAEYLRRARAR